MATIHVARDGTNIGTFSVEEIREGLGTGRFRPTDMAWEAGMSDWRPLSEVMAGKPGAATSAPGAGTTDANVLSVSSSGPSAAGGGLPWIISSAQGELRADGALTISVRPGAGAGGTGAR